jgi:hypothetical protein
MSYLNIIDMIILSKAKPLAARLRARNCFVMNVFKIIDTVGT